MNKALVIFSALALLAIAVEVVQMFAAAGRSP